MKSHFSRLSYANVMSTLGVFLALGGVSYAAVALPKNSVGAKQLKKGGVSSLKVKDGSLLTKDFKLSERNLLNGAPGARGATGAAGAPGADGPRGIQGSQGTPGTNGSGGSQGPQGPQGPAGPVAAASVSSTANFQPGGTLVTVASLTGTGGSGAITLSQTARLYINGTVALLNGSSTTHEIRCIPVYSLQGSGTIQAAGFSNYQDVPAQFGFDQQLPVTGRTGLLAAGSYDVQIQCAGDGGMNAGYAQFNVIAQ